MDRKFFAELLAKCGWTPDRQSTGQPLLDEYSKAGFDVCEELKNQVRHVSGLVVPVPRGRFYYWANLSRAPQLKFWTTLRECTYIEGLGSEGEILWESPEFGEQVRRFRELCNRFFNKRILMVGESELDDLLMYIDEDGGLLSDGYGGRFRWGETFVESMINFRRLTPIKGLDKLR